ncbi:MAG: hypothetical protein J0H31_15165 [Alphaproteobacteria bacterium]|nr:hypothetical protein [Alphaproteobacteria bacterium]
MRYYAQADLLTFSRQWVWIASDRVHEFDDVVGRPIASLDALHSASARYVRRRMSIPPDGSISEVADAFIAMLSELEASGEDVDRVYDWAYCLTPFMQTENAVRAMQIWVETFTRFARGKRDRAKYVDEDFMEQLALSYATAVLQPSIQFSRRCMETRSLWLENASRKTEFDSVLWKYVLEEGHSDPSVFISSGHRDVLVREWWRAMRGTISADQMRGLRLEQAENIRTFSQTRQAWKLDGSVDESMLVAGFPEFDKVARLAN